jgi:hypothetical protein
METREWILKRIEKDGEIALVHEKGIYGIIVRQSDIDWDEYQRRQLGKADAIGK